MAFPHLSFLRVTEEESRTLEWLVQGPTADKLVEQSGFKVVYSSFIPAFFPLHLRHHESNCVQYWTHHLPLPIYSPSSGLCLGHVSYLPHLINQQILFILTLNIFEIHPSLSHSYFYSSLRPQSSLTATTMEVVSSCVMILPFFPIAASDLSFLMKYFKLKIRKKAQHSKYSCTHFWRYQNLVVCLLFCFRSFKEVKQ